MEMLSAGPHRFSNASRWREDLRVKPHAAVDVVVSRKRLGASPRTQTYFSRADSSRPSPRRSTGTTGPNSSAGPPDPGRGGLSRTSSSQRSAAVHWYNHERLHSYLDDVPPVEFEYAFYAVHADREPLVGIK